MASNQFRSPVSYSDLDQARQPGDTLNGQTPMSDRVLRLSAAALAAVLILGLAPASAQSGDPKAAEKAKQSEPAKDSAKKSEELTDVAKATSGPAGQPECKWLGERVVGRLAHDDLDTAFRHLDLYDRFGCPGGHIQAAFRCFVRQPKIDRKAEKADETHHGRVVACWSNPALQLPAAAQNPAAPTGTSTQ